MINERLIICYTKFDQSIHHWKIIAVNLLWLCHSNRIHQKFRNNFEVWKQVFRFANFHENTVENKILKSIFFFFWLFLNRIYDFQISNLYRWTSFCLISSWNSILSVITRSYELITCKHNDASRLTTIRSQVFEINYCQLNCFLFARIMKSRLRASAAASLWKLMKIRLERSASDLIIQIAIKKIAFVFEMRRARDFMQCDSNCSSSTSVCSPALSYRKVDSVFDDV